MVLQKQKITIPLAQGVDTKTDPKRTTGNIEVTNAYQPYTGELRKRRGMSALSASVIGGTATTAKYPRAVVESPTGNLIVAAHDTANATGNPVTAHSLNPVPLLALGRAVDGRTLEDGVLADVAPTILELAGLPRWERMTGRSLLAPV